MTAALATTALGASAAVANTWDFQGVVAFCDPIACSIAGIAAGDELLGFLKANDAASGPNMTFTATDITDYLIVSGEVRVGFDDSEINDATLTTDADDEIASGIIHFSGTFDGGIFGPIDLDVTLDATHDTWTVDTDFLGRGTVASGTGSFLHEPDGDDRGAIEDNCLLIANADQRDTDADGFGNVCDGDFDDNCAVNFLDLGAMKAAFFQPGTTDTDMDGDGETSFSDLGLLKAQFFQPPGPSGLPNDCTPAPSPRRVAR
jgi:hypothetical protein